MSLLKRFTTRPDGVTSKNAEDFPRTWPNSRRWRATAARTPPNANPKALRTAIVQNRPQKQNGHKQQQQQQPLETKQEHHAAVVVIHVAALVIAVAGKNEKTYESAFAYPRI